MKEFTNSKAVELIDIYDEHKNKTGRIVGRKKGIRLNKGEYIISVQCWILNLENKILLTRRRLGKKNGGMWEPTTGLLQSGETSLEGIKRELVEEIGYLVNDEEIQFLNTRMDEREDVSFIRDTYLIKKDIDLQNLQFNDGEVIDAKYVSIEEFKKMIDNNEIVNWLSFFVEIYYENMKK